VVAAAIYWAGPAKVWEVLSKAELKFVVAAVSLAVPLVLIKGVRWKILLHSYDIEMGLRESTGMYATGMVLSAVTPGRVGDMVKIVLLIRRGCGVAKAIACNIVDRLFDVAFVVAAGYTGMWCFSQHFGPQLRIVNIVVLAVWGLPAIFLLTRKAMKRLAMKLIPEQYHSAARESWNEIAGGLWKKGKSRLLLLALLTIVFWLVQFYAVYLCARSLGLDIPFVYLGGCTAVASVLSLLPITVAGVGTRDATFMLLLGQMGIARQESLALSGLALAVFLVNCVIFYIISAVPGGGAKGLDK